MTSPSICKNCGFTTSGNYCEQCGQRTTVSKITLHSLLHEVFHYFTHLDKGFGYTLKKLMTEPGAMQRKYLEGERTRHQKPFSMFFICGTISGLSYYFINAAVARLYGFQDVAESDFFRHYFVIIQAVLLPLYTLVTWLCFRNEKYSYAETLIMQLYNLSLIFLVLVPIISIRLLFPDYENRIPELLFIGFYNTITNFHFYEGKKSWIVLKTILAIVVCYLLSNAASTLIIQLLHR